MDTRVGTILSRSGSAGVLCPGGLMSVPASGLAAAGVSARVRRGSGSVRGFTLIELLIALAAVSILVLGVAQVFSLTSQTVASGRRLSNVQSTAAALERQLRADFAAMTRDGFMAIRHAYSTDDRLSPFNVRLVPGDENPRPRRADELVFFVRGQFVSLGTPRFPGMTATSPVARIYYGHGMQQPRGSADANPLQLNSRYGGSGPGSLARTRLGEASGGGVINPNEYASNWVLVRHAALLVPPTALIDRGGFPVPANQLPATLQSSPNGWGDSEFQVGLQPAVASLFRNLASLQPQPAPGSVARSTAEQPTMESGLADVAIGDLGQIKSIVKSGYNTTDSRLRRPSDPASPLAQVSGTRPGVTGLPAAYAEQSWMYEAFPANSAAGERIRAEVSAPNLFGLPTPASQLDYQRRDQQMLTSSVLLPKVTEFIVEWSFGQPDPVQTSPTFGRLLWYGLPRQVNVDDAGRATESTYIVRPYADRQTDPLLSLIVPRTPTTSDPNTSLRWDVRRDLIHAGVNPRQDLRPLYDSQQPGPGSNRQLFSFFGYTDPTYTPRTGSAGDYVAPGTPVQRGNTVRYSPDTGSRLGDPDTVPWAWPRLIRITVTLADPNDPRVEQTFQYVLPTPDTRAGAN